MPGITGLIYPDSFQIKSPLIPMLRALTSRGGAHHEEHHYKGFQVGICGGNLATCEGVVLGLDGILYNIDKLRAEITSHGILLKNENSSELLIHAYNVWGISFLEHIDGEFALFILDKKKEKLILARDRIGKKPLYWYKSQKYFIFSSELKGILASGIVPNTPALDAFATYFYLGFIPQDITAIQGINKLLPAYFLEYNKDKSSNISSYWSYSHFFQTKTTDDRSTTIREIDTLLQNAVTERIPFNTPFGCALSGALGSASVAYYLQKCVPTDQFTTYTVAFENENMEDLANAKQIAEILHLSHSKSIIKPSNFLDDLVKIVWHLDEPMADPNVLTTWRLGTIAKPVKILFSGIGSEELFVGHSRYAVENKDKNDPAYVYKHLVAAIKTFFMPFLRLFNQQAALQLLRESRSDAKQLQFLNQSAIFPKNILSKAAPLIAHLFDPNVFLQRFYNLNKIPSNISSYLYLDVKTRLPDAHILQYDRLFAANNVDWRAPYLSTDLIEYLATLQEPDEMMSQETFSLLKAILHNALPPKVLNQPKQPRRTFLEPWIENTELVKIFQMLPKGSLAETGVVSSKWLKQQVSTPQLRMENFGYLWSILMLEIWYRLYINQLPTTEPPKMTVMELFEL